MTEQISDKQIGNQIAEALGEPNVVLIRQIITVIGAARAQEVLGKTLELEAQGGILTREGDRRRTPGGVFFHLVRQTIAGSEKRKIWPFIKPSTPSAAPKPIELTWAQALELVKQVKEQPGEAKTVKVTLIGRPLKIIKQAECVILSMKGKEPGSLPKGLPTPPADSAITWAVFIANKQWAKVATSIETQQEDKLIVEGYPLLKDGIAVVLAQSCKSVFLEKAAKAQKGDI